MNAIQRQVIRGRRRRGARPGGGIPWWLIAVLGLGALGSIMVAVGIGVIYGVYTSYAADYVPIEEKLSQTNAGLTEIYDRGGTKDGVLLGALTNPDAQLLNPVPLTDISKFMIQATISTEDNSFEDNPGVNFQGLIRAAYENYLGGGIGSGTGGSSITQQLVKNVYICPSIIAEDFDRCVAAPREGRKGLERKLQEIAFALELEKDYTKDQILGWYLNQISYADRYIGVQAAAQGYFHVDAKDLTLGEAALLAGIPQAPTLYHPRLNCLKVDDDPGNCVNDELGRTTVTGEAKTRQESVLDLMVVHHRATQEEVDAAKAEVVKVFAQTNPLKASAFIDDQIEPRLVRMCEKGLLPKTKEAPDCTSSVHSAGWKVTTTLDWKQTDAAEQMIRSFINVGLTNGCQCNNGAIATIDPATGQVMVYAPNRDPSFVSDRRVAGDIDQLVEINQPGSSFKPVVYLTFFDFAGKNPMSTLWDTSPLVVGSTAITNPRNDGKTTEGLITARAALGGSQNVGAFRAAAEGGVDNVIEVAKKMGITTLDQGFDPTFRSHPDVTYGASIATGGANIRIIDMAYMNSVISNMGVMVGVPHLAKTVEIKDMRSLALDTGENYDLARKQALDFRRGNIRLPGTRELDPVVVLQVQDKDGNVLFTQGPPETRRVINAGSVWLLFSIMSDCNARFIIWGCGSTNNDLALDFYADGIRIPSGVKTGTQQGPKNAADTLANWMNGFSRYAATSVWIGNADKSLVSDVNFAAGNTASRLFKNWMGAYHSYLRSQGVFNQPAGFDSLRPNNVAQKEILSPTTEKGAKGGCDQKVTGWIRTDISYESECEEKDIDSRNGLLASDQTPAQFIVKRKFVKLPLFKPEPAQELAKKMNIPIAPTEKSNGQVAVELTNLSNGKTITATTQVIGTVQDGGLKTWKLEIAPGANPAATDWLAIGGGTTKVTNGVLGTIDVSALENGVYTVRLTADDSIVQGLLIAVTINIRKGATVATPTPTPGGTTTPAAGTPTPTRTPTPTGTATATTTAN
jgi:membrane peptidoglycan carboxypeptidase